MDNIRLRIKAALWILRDAAFVILLSTGLAFAVNLLRETNRIPFVATKAYEILVPCPEYAGKAKSIDAHELVLDEKGVLFIDARETASYKNWHPTGALSIPFDYLGPTSKDSIHNILSSKARRIIVYGDGENPDSGEQLANELLGKGIRNVFFLKGGVLTIKAKQKQQRMP